MNWLCIELHKSLNRLDFIVFNWILDRVHFKMMSWRKLSNILSWRGLQKARADLCDQGMSLELQWGGTWDRGTGQERDGIELRQIVWTSRLGRELLTLGQSHLSSSLFFVHFFFPLELFSSFLKNTIFRSRQETQQPHHYLRQPSKKRLISRNENMPRQDQDRFQKASCQDERPRSFITLSKEYKESLCQSRYILRHNPSL